MSSSQASDRLLNESINNNDSNLPTHEEPSTSTESSSSRSTQYSFTPENSKTSTKPDTEKKDSEKKDDSMYECNICLDIAKDSVITLCGHLFCWSCLSCWLETRPHRQLCPVCKASISKEKVVPLYGRNCSEQQDPRSKIPPRPAGQREPDNSQNYHQGYQAGFQGTEGFHLSFGIGAFPFGFFASSFNFNDLRQRNGQQPGTAQLEEDQFLSKVFLWVAMMFFFWLILA